MLMRLASDFAHGVGHRRDVRDTASDDGWAAMGSIAPSVMGRKTNATPELHQQIRCEMDRVLIDHDPWIDLPGQTVARDKMMIS
ncbi:MAG: hypothetical protein ACR2PO_09085, partial [Methyloligellaceae bacterium]